MPVCARCTGIYFGAAVGALVALVAPLKRRPNGTVHATRAALIVAALPTLLTLLYEWTTGDMPSHAIRAAAGFPIGVVVAWLVVAAADNQVN